MIIEKILKLFRKYKCNHCWLLKQRSNVLLQDEMGYPLRLCLFRCINCSKTKHMWIDVDEEELKELKTGESVLVQWR